MYLRKLEMKDAPLMLEWMHDEDVTENLRANFKSKTLADAENFVRGSEDISKDIHLAIASDKDEYMGTVSLKNIDRKSSSAEFGITVRRCAMGHGYSWFGMKEIIQKAFHEYGLERVYWCVSRNNARAVRFYDKHNFPEAMDIPEDILNSYLDVSNLKWYSVLKSNVAEDRKVVAGCRVVCINTISTEGAGALSFFESERDIDFDVKRIYYITKVPEGIRRGFHAHKELKQLLFCPYGRVQLILENELGREEIELSDPSVGVIIDRPTWREMLWLQNDSVLCVAASDFYSEDDYIRDYHEFSAYIKDRENLND